MVVAQLQDGSTLEVEIAGTGPAVLLAVNPTPVEGPQAEVMRQWGTDPALGRSLMAGLEDVFRVVAFDYEGHVLAHPRPDDLTPDTVAADLLAVADAAGATRFAYYGYSWLALAGLQLALRTGRLTALAMGGFPPIGGPYQGMLRVTTATYDMARRRQSSGEGGGEGGGADGGADGGTDGGAAGGASAAEFDWSTAEVTMSEAQTRQFMTLYLALQDFDDLAAQRRLTCPRLCFAGSADEIDYDQRWGGVRVSFVGPLLHRRDELAALGWEVRVLDGLDHTGAMQAGAVLPVLRPWLRSALN